VETVSRLKPLVLIAGALLSTVALADYKKSYGLGLKAVNQSNWSDAARHMREALNDRAEPQVRARLTGMEIKPYVPQLYLALALAKSGQCAETSALLTQPGVPQTIAQLPELMTLRTQVSALCANSVVASPPVAAPKAQPATVPAPTSAPTVAVKGSVPPKTSAAPPPVQTPAKPPVAVNTTPPPPKPAAPETPAALLSLAANFLQGNYAQVAASNPDVLPNPRAQAFALGLRAAAKLMQAQANPANAASLSASAKADLTRAKALDPQFKLNPAAFSPRIRAAVAG
jgi:hypothetical protein